MHPVMWRLKKHSPAHRGPGIARPMTVIRASAWMGLAALGTLLIAHAAHAESSAYADGLAERTAYEDWFAHLGDAEKSGAAYWASQRSLSKPGACVAPSGVSADPWRAGCHEAQRRLGPTDA